MTGEPATAAFADLGLPASLLKTVASVGYETPSPIQAGTIPPLLEGRDLMGQAQTGTGKTAAFALPILARLRPGSKRPGALVLCPTRELAIQVAEAFQTYARGIKNFHVLPVYGGQDMRGQLQQLKRGVDVVVGTPGRLLDHLKRGSLDLGELQTVVLDEADEMLRMGFIDDVELILSHAGGEQQTVLFSATLPTRIQGVARKFLKDPVHIKITTRSATVDAIDQQYWLLNNNQKLDALTRLLEAETFDGVIVFTRTRGTTTELAEKISARGYACAAINGDMSQSVREQTIQRLKRGKIDILVATDVAARGLDVTRISLVVNYDIPYDAEAYIHRIGRTGRAGREGKAVLFVTRREQRLLRTIEKATRKDIVPIRLPTAEEVLALRVQRFKQEVCQSLAEPASPLLLTVVEELCAETGIDLPELAAGLVKMLQKDQPLELSLAAAMPADKRQRPPRLAPPDAGSKHKSRGPARQQESRKSRGGKAAAEPEAAVDMDTFRIEVGLQHEVTPGNIVGAISNEIDIESRYIGRIKIHDEYSMVDLPAGMPKELFEHLQSVRVCSRPLKISRVGKSTGKSARSHKSAAPGSTAGKAAAKQLGPTRFAAKKARPNKPSTRDKVKDKGKGKRKGKANAAGT